MTCVVVRDSPVTLATSGDAPLTTVTTAATADTCGAGDALAWSVAVNAEVIECPR